MSQIQDNSPVKLSDVSVASTLNGTERMMTTRISIGTSVAKTVAVPIQTIINAVTSSVLVPTGVSAGTYGTATATPQITIDQYGRITSAQRVSTGYPAAPNTITVVSCSTSSFVATSPDSTINIHGGTGMDTAIVNGILVLTMKNTTASAGTYGTAGVIPQIVVDAQGRITDVQRVSVSLQNTFVKVSCSTSSYSATTPTDTINIHGGTGLDAAVINGIITLTMNNTAASVGTYGTSNIIPQITVDQQGRITNLQRVSVNNVIAVVSCSTSSFTASTPTDTLNLRGGLGLDAAVVNGILTLAMQTTALREVIALTPSADQNNYSTGATLTDGRDTIINIAPTNSIQITGILATSAINGKKVTIRNSTSSTAATARMILIPRQSTASTAANRLDYTPMAIPLMLMPGDSVTFAYNTVTSLWEYQSSSRNGSPNAFFTTFTDYFNTSGSGDLQGTTSSGVSAGANVPSSLVGDATQKVMGAYGVTTGTTTTGYAYTGSGSSTIKGGAGASMFLARVFPEALSNGTDTYKARAGFMDASTTGTPVDGLYWEYDQATSTAWRSASSNNSTVTINTVTGFTVSITAVHYLGVFVNGDWTNVEYFYSADGATWTFFATQITTNIPTNGARLFGVQFGLTKSAGLTGVNFDADMMGFRCDATRGT